MNKQDITRDQAAKSKKREFSYMVIQQKNTKLKIYFALRMLLLSVILKREYQNYGFRVRKTVGY